MDKKIKEITLYLLLILSFLLVISALLFILFVTFRYSWGTLNWSFISQMPRNGMTEGGVLPMLVGTLLVTFLSAIFSIPFGVFCAIYLSEYARDNAYTRLIKLSIRNLAAVPSIVFGLFGLAIFVKSMQLGTSAISAGLTLGLLTLPTVITSAEEALKTVPKAYKEGAFALGLTQWQVLYSNVIPVAMPGIMTGVILGLSRALGETAPIMFTGVAFYLPKLSLDVTQQFMSLPYHLFIMSTQHHDINGVKGIAYATAGLLILISLVLNLIASNIRYRYKKGLS